MRNKVAYAPFEQGQKKDKSLTIRNIDVPTILNFVLYFSGTLVKAMHFSARL